LLPLPAEVLLGAALTQPVPGTVVVECAPARDAKQRIYRLVDRGAGAEPRWWLTMEARHLGGSIIELPLTGARVEQTDERVRVAAASRNGGVAISMDSGGEQPILDVFVNFELEVNVWRDLSPGVDEMNTNGPLADPGCRRLAGPPR
jgi:hypothetical protein